MRVTSNHAYMHVKEDDKREGWKLFEYFIKLTISKLSLILKDFKIYCKYFHAELNKYD